jgi:hypothetical protein
MNIPWTGISFPFGSSRSKQVKDTEALRHQVQTHPEEAQAHCELGFRLHSENEHQVRLHKRFQIAWTEANVQEWYQRQEEAIQELAEAIRLFRTDPDLQSHPEKSQECACAHYWLASILRALGKTTQAQAEWESCLQWATGELAHSARKQLQRLNREKYTLLRAASICETSTDNLLHPVCGPDTH